MKTRILMEKLIGEDSYTYFLDYFDENRMEWKNHYSHKNLTSVEFARNDLINSNLECETPKPKRYSDYAEKQQTNYMETSLIITGNHYRR